MNKYIDIGVNLTSSSFNKDLPQVIDRAREAGIERLIVTGTNIEHSEHAIRLSELYAPVCLATVGLHPHHASEFSSDTYSELREMLGQPHVVAVGECGLDFNRNYSTRKEQVRAFEAQLELAIDLRKPMFLHQRDAHSEMLAMLKSCRNELRQVVAHCFTGTADEVSDYLALDMYIGITGWICDERRGQALKRAVKRIPLDRIMLETDAPYLLPRDMEEKPHEKNRNEPCYLPHIARSVAGFMGVDEKQLVTAAYKNSYEFFMK
jgi:TatD DNase family protein